MPLSGRQWPSDSVVHTGPHARGKDHDGKGLLLPAGAAPAVARELEGGLDSVFSGAGPWSHCPCSDKWQGAW